MRWCVAQGGRHGNDVPRARAATPHLRFGGRRDPLHQRCGRSLPGWRRWQHWLPGESVEVFSSAELILLGHGRLGQRAVLRCVGGCAGAWRGPHVHARGAAGHQVAPKNHFLCCLTGAVLTAVQNGTGKTMDLRKSGAIASPSPSPPAPPPPIRPATCPTFVASRSRILRTMHFDDHQVVSGPLSSRLSASSQGL